MNEVWLSHWHEDHLAYLDLFEGLPLRQMAVEAEPLSGIEAFLDWYGIGREEYRDYWRRTLPADFTSGRARRHSISRRAKSSTSAHAASR